MTLKKKIYGCTLTWIKLSSISLKKIICVNSQTFNFHCRVHYYRIETEESINGEISQQQQQRRRPTTVKATTAVREGTIVDPGIGRNIVIRSTRKNNNNNNNSTSSGYSSHSPPLFPFSSSATTCNSYTIIGSGPNAVATDSLVNNSSTTKTTTSTSTTSGRGVGFDFGDSASGGNKKTFGNNKTTLSPIRESGEIIPRPIWPMSPSDNDDSSGEHSSSPDITTCDSSDHNKRRQSNNKNRRKTSEYKYIFYKIFIEIN